MHQKVISQQNIFGPWGPNVALSPWIPLAEQTFDASLAAAFFSAPIGGFAKSNESSSYPSQTHRDW